ncbi:hypothetical protein BRARA_A00707 [Brassica rapa]|uniref:Expansin-like EG45 domain-containing protein n=5 Tax=Brassica TaxID=3705 RepID=A0A3P5ZNW9_BRACM|nr:putative EG45-like domain containing protein 1 precursor [Brassica rapa]KAG5413113.1 hypothetical protein IGI04_000680 [Brassica rapa subsp. trilocularis]CAF2147789.1 unnamed protein product [Brassica napus]AGM16374.1 beta-expansin-like protein 2 [Brassica rapa]RID77828.1 hypothetical protein BRARA_A00707 [Brassica rapa]CAG7886686.1 unnamed protein product [Brassica rapa]
MGKCILVSSVVIVSLFSIAYATSGIGTFYTTYTPSACYKDTPEGVMIAAASDTLWDNGRVCGKMFHVTCTGPRNPVPHPCTGKTVTVKIVDHCPAGCASTIDLSFEAFSQIANPVAGIINIDYTP